MTTSATPATNPAVQQQAAPLAQFTDAFERESATTLKVLRAYPPEKAELKPSEKSKSARELAWIFTMEQALFARAMKDQLRMPPSGPMPAAPASWDEVVRAFDKSRTETLDMLRGMRDEEFAGTTQFFTAPKTFGDIPKVQFAWFLLFDQIHHRGQLSVYLRIAGGKVPSIYGPTADEPWF